MREVARVFTIKVFDHFELNSLKSHTANRSFFGLLLLNEINSFLLYNQLDYKTLLQIMYTDFIGFKKFLNLFCLCALLFC